MHPSVLQLLQWQIIVKYVVPLDSFATYLVLNILRIFSGFKVKMNSPYKEQFVPKEEYLSRAICRLNFRQSIIFLNEL